MMIFFAILIGAALLLGGVAILTELSKQNHCIGDLATCGADFFKGSVPKANGINLSDPYQIIVFLIVLVLVFIGVYLLLGAFRDNRQAKIKQTDTTSTDTTKASNSNPGSFRRSRSW